MATEAAPGELLDRVQSLTTQVDELQDPRARELAHQLAGAVIAMYGDGLSRIMETIAGSREAGATILDELSQDGAVASLLLIHDLYPVSLEQRVLEALDTVRPYMESHGGNVELLAIEEGVAKLALQGSCSGCAASQATLELAIKQALDEHAPDLAGLEVEGVAEPAPPPPSEAFELPMVDWDPAQEPAHPLAHPPAALPVLNGSGPPRWVPLDGQAEVGRGDLAAIDVEGAQLLLANVDGSLLAYRDECAACGASLRDGELNGGMLRCRGCDAEFDLPRAGRAAGGEPLQLAPVPLLQEGGVRVAV
jgi:Fe-S cluster biogenesis protein NfuA/nitrite reductase/ring-hydroxylating ferredoxin subunit